MQVVTGVADIPGKNEDIRLPRSRSRVAVARDRQQEHLEITAFRRFFRVRRHAAGSLAVYAGLRESIRNGQEPLR